ARQHVLHVAERPDHETGEPRGIDTSIPGLILYIDRVRRYAALLVERRDGARDVLRQDCNVHVIRQGIVCNESDRESWAVIENGHTWWRAVPHVCQCACAAVHDDRVRLTER